MINLKRLCICASVVTLGACSYFDTGERIEVHSSDLERQDVFVDEGSVENVIYRDTHGAVEIYNLDVREQEAVDNFVPFSRPVAQKDEAAMELSPSVDIYPIDIPMQKTLKP